MITIRVSVALPSNQTHDLELPLNTDIDHLYARLVARASLPTTTERGEPIPYGFYHRRSERYLPAHVSLVDAGVVNGDMIDVVPYPTVGPPLRALQEAHLYREHRFVPARWLVGYTLAIAAIIALVVLLAAQQAGQPVADFVDANPLSTSIEPGSLSEATTYMRDDGDAGLVVQPGSFSARATLSERKVPNPSPGVAGLPDVLGPVFEFMMVSEGGIVEPVVVKLRSPVAPGEAHTPGLTVVRWDEAVGAWTLLPTRLETDGYLYAPTLALGTFGVAEAGEILLAHGDGTLEPGSYWALTRDGAPRVALSDAEGWLSADELASLTGLVALGLERVAAAPLTEAALDANTLAVSATALLDDAHAPGARAVTPMPEDNRPVASGEDVKTTAWKTVQVMAPVPYEDGPGWSVVPVRTRLVQRDDALYLEYATDADTLEALAPVDFVWLAYSSDGDWTTARLNADQLESGRIGLHMAPVRLSLVTYGQPYEAWAVWGPGEDRRSFSVGSVSWGVEANLNTPTAERSAPDAVWSTTTVQADEALTPCITSAPPLPPMARVAAN